MVRVVVADDQPALRRLYARALAGSRFEVVGEAGDGDQAVAAALGCQAEAVLLDLSMPRRDGLEAIGLLRGACPSMRIVVLSGFGAERLGPLARELGASGFLEKGAPPAAMVAALEDAMARPPAPFLSPGVARREQLVRRAREML